MNDMLVKLYDLKDSRAFLEAQEKLGITIRKPIGPEKHILIDWVRKNFSTEWAGEIDVAMSNMPISCFVAVREEQFIGFSCYDATALGFFGPLGVIQPSQGKGTGKALLLSSLLDMKLKGYGYAVIGQTDRPEFYQRCAAATAIPDSASSIWKTWVKPKID